MPPIQTRKSISLKGTTYAKLKKHAEEAGVSMSSVVEDLLAEFLPDTRLVDSSNPSNDTDERLQAIKKSHKQRAANFTF